MKLSLLLILILFSINSFSQQVLGIDVYSGTGALTQQDWNTIKAANKSFAIVKASDGVGTVDARLDYNVPYAVNAQLKVGVYHFCRAYHHTPEEEANYFLSVAKQYIGKGFLPPTIDVEDPTDAPTIHLYNYFNQATLTAWLQTWLSIVQNATGVTPMIYSSSVDYASWLSNLHGYKLWVASPDNCSTCPPNTGGWPTWTFKQYSWTGTVSGLSGKVFDLDVFNGDINSLNSLTNSTPSQPPANDNCTSATSLSSSISCNYLNNQTVNNATASGKTKAGCDGYTGTSALDDVWYSFQAVSTSHTITVDPNGSQLDAVITAYNSCSDNTEFACSDTQGGNGGISTLNLTNLTIGKTYYIRIYDYGLQTTDGNFRICLTHSIACTAPTTQASNIIFPLPGITPNTLTAQWTNGNGSRRVVYINTTNSFTAPANGTDPTANTTYGGSGQQCIFNGTNNSAPVSNLFCNTTYYFRIYEANCSGGSSVYNATTATLNPNNQLTGGCPCTTPAAPNAIIASSVTAISFRANWNVVTGATAYRMDVATDPSFTNLIYNDVIGNAGYLDINAVNCNTTYYYRVRAIGSCGPSANSNTITVTTSPCCSVPAAPTATTATNPTATGFIANWNAVSGVTGYYLEVSANNSFNSYVNGYNNVSVNNVTSFSVNGLSCNTTYYYRVRAGNGCGASSSSNVVSAITSSCCTTPVIPVISPAGPLQLCNGENATLTVSNPCAGCTYMWSDGATGVSRSVGSSGDYSVKAQNSCSTSSNSNTVSVNVAAPPSTPTFTSSTGQFSVCQNGSLTLTANSPNCTSCTYSWNTGVNGNSITITNLTSTTTYSVTVQNQCGSSKNNPVIITVNPLPTLSTTATPNPVCRNGTLVLKASGASTYTWNGINLNATSGAQVTANPATLGVVTYTVTGTTSGCSTNQDIQVTVNDITSPECVTTAVPNVDGLEEFTIIPNPNKGVFSVRMKFTSMKNVQFTLTSLLGQTVYQSSTTHYTGTVIKQINASNLANGIYQLKASINNKTIVQKVIISR